MKLLKNGLIASLLVLSTAAFAQEGRSIYSGSRPSSSGGGGNVGVGVMVGSPSGLNAKIWANSNLATNLGLGYTSDGYLSALGDILYHFPGTFSSLGPSGNEFVPYVGLGAIAYGHVQSGAATEGFLASDHRDDLGIALHVPVGVEYLPQALPIGIFAELAPGFAVLPGGFGFWKGDVGLHWYIG